MVQNMSSTFETLPDEILMIIFKYSGDVQTIFRTFLGLNKRLNRILVDKRLHLLTDYLSIDTQHAYFNDYYNSTVFSEVSHQLSSINGIVTEIQLDQCFQSLMIFHIQEQYKRSGDELQANLTMFEAVRQHLTNDEMIDVDKKLYEIFNNLLSHPININDIKQIDLLVFQKGARLHCDNSENSSCSFAIVINRLLIYDLNNMKSTDKQLFHLKTRLFKTLFVSNPRLLFNRDYYIYRDFPAWYFLFYAIYRTLYHGYHSCILPVSIECYKAVLNLVFFALQYQKRQFDIEDWAQENLFYILSMIPTLELVHKKELFIETVQWEILKIMTDIYLSSGVTTWLDSDNESFHSILSSLIDKNRRDVILFIYRRLNHVRTFFNQPRNCRGIVDTMTRNKLGRQLLEILMNENLLEPWVTSKDFLFILLQKKERKLLEKLFKISPCLLHQLDEHGNDPLLYICLNVRGCRHQLVEFLISMKADLQRKNFHGEDFLQAIQLDRNRKLLDKLNVELTKTKDEQVEFIEM